MFKILASEDSKPFVEAKEFIVEPNYVFFFTPQKEPLSFCHKTQAPTELIRWCECRLNNSKNSKNIVKISPAR